ncbi:hypothetical protein FOCC_FOCC007433 [Frankliniella occidentalis]|nr:hypothetical protein FOCC_FOCC007433 [Frankliniella occidentalis]
MTETDREKYRKSKDILAKTSLGHQAKFHVSKVGRRRGLDYHEKGEASIAKNTGSTINDTMVLYRIHRAANDHGRPPLGNLRLPIKNNP